MVLAQDSGHTSPISKQPESAFTKPGTRQHTHTVLPQPGRPRSRRGRAGAPTPEASPRRGNSRLLPLSSCGCPSVRVCTPTSSSDEDPSCTGVEPALVTLFCLNHLFKSPLQVQSRSEVPGNLRASPCGFGGKRFSPEHLGSGGRRGTSCGAPKVLEVGAKELYLRIFLYACP